MYVCTCLLVLKEIKISNIHNIIYLLFIFSVYRNGKWNRREKGKKKEIYVAKGEIRRLRKKKIKTICQMWR